MAAKAILNPAFLFLFSIIGWLVEFWFCSIHGLLVYFIHVFEIQPAFVLEQKYFCQKHQMCYSLAWILIICNIFFFFPSDQVFEIGVLDIFGFEEFQKNTFEQASVDVLLNLLYLLLIL